MLWLTSSLFFSCAEGEMKQPVTEASASPIGTCDQGETIVAVFSYFGVARDENGVAWGFNLDEHVSDASDEEGCYKDDLVDPLGNEGIDNAFASLITAIETVQAEAEALESLGQQSLNTGALILMIEITGVDDWENDDCITVGLYRGQGIPMIGTDGFMLDGQSFERDLSLPHSVVENVKIENGHISARPLEIQLPVQILDEFLDFYISNGGFDITLTKDGGMQGFFGGAIPITALTDIATLPDVNLPEGIVTLLASAADLYPNDDDVCEDLSLAFQYEAIPAHFYLEE